MGVEDVQPNFGKVRGRFERLSLPSLIEMEKVNPSSQQQPAATSLPPNLQQRQEKSTNMAKLVAVRKIQQDNNQPGTASAKGRVRELVRMIDLSKGRISHS